MRKYLFMMLAVLAVACQKDDHYVNKLDSGPSLGVLVDNSILLRSEGGVANVSVDADCALLRIMVATFDENKDVSYESTNIYQNTPKDMTFSDIAKAPLTFKKYGVTVTRLGTRNFKIEVDPNCEWDVLSCYFYEPGTGDYSNDQLITLTPIPELGIPAKVN